VTKNPDIRIIYQAGPRLPVNIDRTRRRSGAGGNMVLVMRKWQAATKDSPGEGPAR
jgi:hypothetical protein